MKYKEKYNKKVQILVYESTISNNVIKSFSTLRDFDKWIECDKNVNLDIFADQVSINGYILMGFDELFDFI